MNRILLEPEELQGAGGEALLTDGRAVHLRSVLKVVPGTTVRVGLLDGACGEGEVIRVDAGGALLHLRWEEAVPDVPRADVLLALPRPKVMKRLWSQLAAIGVGRIYVTNAEKVERNYFDTHVLEESFVRRQLIEGLQQCGDTRLPRFSVHRRLKVLLEDELGGEADRRMRLLAHPGVPLRMGAALAAKRPDRALLAVGPEGGWTPYELELFQRHGFLAVSAGERILRSDTACIALTAVLHENLR